MAAKVFVLGRPGSGKTTAVRHMHELYSRMGGRQGELEIMRSSTRCSLTIRKNI